MKRFKDFLKEADIFGGNRSPQMQGMMNRQRGIGPGPSSLSAREPSSTPAYSGSAPRSPGALSGAISSPSTMMSKPVLTPKDTSADFTPHSPRNPGDNPRNPGGLSPGGRTYKDLEPGNDGPLTYRSQDKRENVPTSAEGGRKKPKK